MVVLPGLFDDGRNNGRGIERKHGRGRGIRLVKLNNIKSSVNGCTCLRLRSLLKRV